MVGRATIMTGNDDPRPVPFATTSLPGSDFAIFSRPPPLSHPFPVADATSNFRYGVPPIHLPSCRRLSSLVRYKVTIRPSSSTWRAFSRSIPTPTPPLFSDTTCFLIFLFLFFSSNARDRGIELIEWFSSIKIYLILLLLHLFLFLLRERWVR